MTKSLDPKFLKNGKVTDLIDYISFIMYL